MLLALILGFVFGFAGSMPVAGPIAVLVLHLGLAHDPRHALWVAIGGSLAESGYALLAFWGLSTVLDHYPVILPASRTAGMVLLFLAGVALLLARPKPVPPEEPGRERKGTKRSFLAGFLITAINPTLLVTWTAAVAALSSTGILSMSHQEAIPFALGTGAGIVAWFSTLLWLVGKFRGNWSHAFQSGIMKVMGTILVVAAGWMAVRALASAPRKNKERGAAWAGPPPEQSLS